MTSCFNEDFMKMTEGFATIVAFALISFFLLNYLSKDEQLSGIIASIFNNIVK